MFKRCVAVLLMAAMLIGVVPLTVHAAPVYYNEAIHTDFDEWLDDLDDDALLLMLFGYAHFDNDAVLYFAFFYYFPHRHYFPISLKGTQPDPWFHPMWGGIIGCPRTVSQASNLFVAMVNNPVMWRDPTGLVIELAGTHEERQTLLSLLQQLTDRYTLGINSYNHLTMTPIMSSFMFGSRQIQWQTGTLHHGSELLSRMVASDHVVRVQITDGRSAHRADSITAFTEGVGSGGTVRLNINNRYYAATTLIHGGVATNTYTPLHIVLAHELIHADRAMRGVQIPQRQTGSVSLQVERNSLHPARLFGSRTHTITHTFALEEMATIGISHFTPFSITENMIRSEHNMLMRVSHRSANAWR